MDLATAIILLLVGVSVLLCGMRLLAGGLKKTVGRKLKNFFRKTQDNPFVGMGIGTAVTTVIQASDATAAMVLGFINAGAMTIYQGVSIILGAYVGTTVTGVIASFSSFPFSLYLLLLAFIGTIMMFFKSDKVKNIGEILIGFGLLFFGIAVMKQAFQQADIHKFCVDLFTVIKNPALLFLIGIIAAALVQSSSAITSIVIAMVGGGALSLAAGLPIVIGATIGSATNTLLASIGASVDSKRTAWICFIMRCVCALLMLIVLLFAGDYIAQGFSAAFGIKTTNPDGTVVVSYELALALFLVAYNLVFMPLMIPFIKPSIKLFSKIIKDKDSDKLASNVHYIDDNLLTSPTIALMQVKKEIISMFQFAADNYKLGFARIFTYSKDHDKEIIETEDVIDYLNGRITDYLIKVANVVGPVDEKKVGSYFHVINDIERIGDHAYNYYEMALEMETKELKFSEDAVNELKEMNDVIDKMFTLSMNIFINKNSKPLNELHDLEEQTDEMKTRFYSNHYERIKQNKCSTDMTPYLSSLITEIERVADHLTNIGYSIVNPTGNEE